MKYEVYTDGSSRGNPGPAGWSCIVMSEDKVREYAGGVPLGTNNQMEIYGVLFAMQFALTNLNKSGLNSDEIHIWSDSEYTVKGCNQWLKGWVKNNWKNSQKKEVLNLNLWKSVNQAISDLEFKNIKWTVNHVRGHAGHVMNERADKLCTSYALKENMQLFEGSREKYEEMLN